MYFDIRKTEKDYEIHIVDHETSITLSDKDFQTLKTLYEKEQHIQIMVSMCEKSGEYHNELFTDFPLWDKIATALDDKIQKEKTNITGITNSDDILVHNAIQDMFEQFKKELNYYKHKSKKKGKVS